MELTPVQKEYLNIECTVEDNVANSQMITVIIYFRQYDMIYVI